MSYSIGYSSRDYRDLDYRLERSMRRSHGFAWGAFFLGFILGGVIF